MKIPLSLSYDRHVPVWERAALDADLTLTLPGGVPMFFRRIPAGSFLMGSRGEAVTEEPIHRVVIPQNFYLGTFVVTQEQYRAVATRCQTLKKEPDPSSFKGPRHPVEQLNWFEATAFCEWLGRWKGLPEEIAAVRLPTEAEWEYACRGCSPTEYYPGDGEVALAEVAWYIENAGNQSHPVDELFEAHPFGLYGMHGNVWEWCRDVFDPNTYRKCPEGWIAEEWTVQDAGANADKDPFRILRGGAWLYTARFCRSAYRGRFGASVRARDFGFRVCLLRVSVPGHGAQPNNKSREHPAPEARVREMMLRAENADFSGAIVSLNGGDSSQLFTRSFAGEVSVSCPTHSVSTTSGRGVGDNSKIGQSADKYLNST